MNLSYSSKATLLAGLLVALATAGCVSRTERHYYSSSTVPSGSVTVATITTPPPAPREEVQGLPPTEGSVWISGYWSYQNGRYTWVPGRWDAPRAGYRWVPHRWVEENGHWRMQEGHWEAELR